MVHFHHGRDPAIYGADFFSFDARRRQLYQYVCAPFGVNVAPSTKAAIIVSFDSVLICGYIARAASAFVLPSAINALPSAIAFLIAGLLMSIGVDDGADAVFADNVSGVLVA